MYLQPKGRESGKKSGKIKARKPNSEQKKKNFKLII